VGSDVGVVNQSERQVGLALDGVLVLDKPPGWTSHDVVAKARALLRVRKVGHTGTLDPSATGVLLLCIGKATRIAEYLMNTDKAYRAVLRLGVSTDTQDATGSVVGRNVGPLPDEATIRTVMSRFVGIHRQVPPMYSAVKVKGVPLYKSARAGQTVTRTSRECKVRGLEILSITPAQLSEAAGSGTTSSSTLDVAFDVVCSKGTYIRTLCADMGDALGVGGHLAHLERRQVGRFRIEEALSLDELAELVEREAVGTRLYSLAAALADLPALTLDDDAAEEVLHGIPVPTARVVRVEGRWVRGAPLRLHAQGGRLLAIGRAPCGAEEFEQVAPGTVVRVEKVLA